MGKSKKNQPEPEWVLIGTLGQYYILKNNRTFELMRTTSKKKAEKLTGDFW